MHRGHRDAPHLQVTGWARPATGAPSHPSATMAPVTPGIWHHEGETAESGPAATTPSARPGPRSRPTSRCTRRGPPACGSACSTTTAPRPRTAHRAARSASGTARCPASRPAQRYGFRADGPWDPAQGCASTRPSCCSTPTPGRSPAQRRPATRRSSATPEDAPDERDDRDSAPYVPRSVVVDDDFDWGGDRPPRRRWRDTVIYEMHVKGITALHDRVPEELRGTYAGLAHAGGHRLPARPRRDRGRAAARAPVRHRAGRGRRAA